MFSFLLSPESIPPEYNAWSVAINLVRSAWKRLMRENLQDPVGFKGTGERGEDE